VPGWDFVFGEGGGGMTARLAQNAKIIAMIRWRSARIAPMGRRICLEHVEAKAVYMQDRFWYALAPAC
jgi:hypothetical protein